MLDEQRIHDEVEETLRAFDALPKLEPDPFLAARLQARLAEPTPENPFARRLKPAALALVVVLNVLTLIHLFRPETKSSSRDQLVQTLSRDYHLTSHTF